MSILLTCSVCGTVWAPDLKHDHDQVCCPATECQAVYRVRIELLRAPAHPKRLVAPSRRVRVGG